MLNQIKKLPDAEFEVMKVIWSNELPITTNFIMKQLEEKKEWKVQTVISLLSRLAERGFISIDKTKKERKYSPLINKDDYLKFETSSFMERFHDNSFPSLVATLYNSQKLNDDDLDDMRKWLEEKRE